MRRHDPWIAALAICLVLAAGCTGGEPPANETDTAVAIALADPEVRDAIDADAGDYEIVEVAQGTYQSADYAATNPVVTFRLHGQRSLYRVVVDVGNATVAAAYWQYVKEPIPCMETGPPEVFSTLEDAAEAAGFACPLAALSSVPEGYGFSAVRVYGDPCPRREVAYANRTDRLLLVQTCAGDPPYAFAISMPEYREVGVNGLPAVLVRGIGENQVSWSSENADFWLRGTVDEEELLAAASSTEPFATPTPAPIPSASEVPKPGISRFGTPRILWPDEITVTAGTTSTGEIVTESREKGYGRVHLRIRSRVTEHATLARTLPMPEEMEISVAPPDFRAYPGETYYATVTVNTTPATPPGRYVLQFHEIFEGSFYGGGWFDVIVTE
ncbi:MAG: hypothetical protein QCH35_10135 [Methanomicrobiaceae archaeon]|nr:hypothetical protein [Methanomicrobiaceae archaeon]